MRFRSCFSALVLGCVLLAGLLSSSTIHAQAKPSAPAASTHDAAHRVVFALTSDDAQDWTLTIANLRNLQKADPGIQIELVAYGPGIQFLTLESSESAEVRSLLNAGIQMMACRHAMQARNLTPADMVEGVHIVPSGVAEVVARQAQGWSYIKAGR